MDMKKCDRCGAIYSDSSQSPSLPQNDAGVKGSSRFSGMVVKWTSVQHYKFGASGEGSLDSNGSIDLCPECSTQFREWLYGIKRISNSKAIM